MTPPSKIEDSSSSSSSSADSSTFVTGNSWYTKVSDIKPGVDRLINAFHTKQKTQDVQFRLNQLRNLYYAVKDNTDELCEALEKDFHRANTETKNLEIVGGLAELVHTMSSLHEWLKPEKVTDLPITLKTNPIYIERIPLGVVLIISPFNYPFFLSFSAIVGAIAGGNAVVLKQSELTPNFQVYLVKF